MSDIVERLRAWRPQAYVPVQELEDLLQEAAAEIERLRKRAGAVSDGEDLAAIKDRVHPGRSPPFASAPTKGRGCR